MGGKRIRLLIRSFAEAWCQLTIIPLPAAVFSIGDPNRRWVISCYPWVGVVLGGMLCGLCAIFPETWPVFLQSVLLVLCWIVLTGGLHLDGLADSIDAIYAGHKDPSVIAAVLKDPRCGSMAVVVLVGQILLKVALVYALYLTYSHSLAILMSLVIARAVVIPFMQSTHYVGNSAWLPQQYLEKCMADYVFYGFIILACTVFCSFPVAVGIFIGVSALSLWWRKLWLTRLGGYVGDTLGGLIEIVETGVLFLIYSTCFL